MSTRLPCCINTKLDNSQLDHLVAKAKDWAIMHGISMRSKSDFSLDSVNIAPFMLLPSSFPRKEFEKAIFLQPLFNELVVRIASNTDFLKRTLKDTTTVDPFTEKLFQILKTVEEEGLSQEACCCGLFRCDYMLDSDTIRQVEINTIASSFGGISTQIPELHKLVLQDLGHPEIITQLPENKTLQGLCQGLVKAWEKYDNPNAFVLFIVEDVTHNICDQRFHEFEIRRQNPKIQILRRTLTQLGNGGANLDSKRKLLIEGREIAVVYFRAGYSPDHYQSSDDIEWNARLMIERSIAVKCPSISFHLAGTKKVQQVLAEPGVLEDLMQDPEKVANIKQVFTGLYSLDLGEAGNRAIKMALENPHAFVLKPQREGGGNNVYGAEVANTLKVLESSPERAAFILMDVIKPPLQGNWMVRPHAPFAYADTTSELGVYGVVLSNGGNILYNSTAGHMLRTKMQSANEGGVAAGQGALDSPFLVDL